MNQGSTALAQPSPADRLEQILAVCEALEAACRAGQQPADRRLPGRESRAGSVGAAPTLAWRGAGAGPRSRANSEPGRSVARFPEFEERIRSVFEEGLNDPARVPRPHPQSATKYETLRPLGEGGQGRTYLARDPALQRQVVLKCYRRGTATAPREAVLNEGRALARVHSPYVAHCYDLEAQDDQMLLVMRSSRGNRCLC